MMHRFDREVLPSVSIIIPVCNEERYVGACLDSLLSQDYAGSFEIIVLDGLSEDATRQIVIEYSGRDKRVRLVSNPECITPAAFNHGIRSARGEILLTVGGHWHLPTDYLSQIDRLFREYPVDCLGGRIVREVDTELGRAIEVARGSSLGGGLAMRNDPTVEEQIVQEANVAYIYRRNVFEKVGLFDERFVRNHDNEFNLRTFRAGLQTLYSPRVVFHYCAPDNFRKLFHQMFGYSSYTPMMIVKHRRLLNASFGIPTVGLLLWLILLVLGVTNLVPIVAPLVLLGIYAFMTMGGALITSLRAEKLRYWPVICIAYLTIHIAVSLGYLCGIFKLFDPSLGISLWRDSHTLAQDESMA